MLRGVGEPMAQHRPRLGAALSPSQAPEGTRYENGYSRSVLALPFNLDLPLVASLTGTPLASPLALVG